MVWAAGHRLQGGKYVIGEILGQGGFGISYKALHIPLNQQVVIKTPNEYLKNDPDYDSYVKRFITEARLLAKLSLLQDPHPHIVRVIDLFQEGETHCLAIEFIPGQSLSELVRRQGALSEVDAISCICQIGEALAFVHQAGLVHRDAHPGNIMLRSNGKAVLIDFRIAGELVPTTVSSTSFGSSYAPYEQMRGSREPSIDVYCLAATLYYAVTGQRPTTSLDRKLYEAALAPPQQINPCISDRLNEGILKGMALEAKDRPQSMQEWLKLLEVPAVATPAPVDSTHRWELDSLDLRKDTSELRSKSNPVSRPTTPQPKINWTVFWAVIAAVAALLAGLNARELVKHLLNTLNQTIHVETSDPNQAADLLNQADEFREAESYQEAIASYNKAIALRPDDAKAHWGLCFSLNQMGKPTQAIAACDRALALNPNYKEALWSKGNALHQKKNYEEEIKLYDQALQIDSKYAEVWNNRGVALLKLQRPDEALKSLENATNSKADWPDAWANRGVALWELRRYDDAIASIEKALKIDPDHPNANNLRQQARRQIGR